MAETRTESFPPLPEYADNHIIEGLPPIRTPPEIQRSFPCPPLLMEVDRRRPPEQRLHAVLRLLHYSQPTVHSRSLGISLDQMIRQSYIGTNPSSSQWMRFASACAPREAEEKGKVKKLGAKRSKSADGVLDQLTAIRDTSMSCLVVGPPGMGKTHTAKTALAHYDQVLFHTKAIQVSQITWLRIECPPDGSLVALCRFFFAAVDKALQEAGITSNLQFEYKTAAFLYWRIDHQLPGVLVCAAHRHRLRRSTVRIASVNRHAFVSASRETCRDDCEPITLPLSGRVLDIAVRVSRASSALIDQAAPALSMVARQAAYRGELSSLGFMRGQHKLDQAYLHSRFNSRFGDLLQRLAGVGLTSSSETWLSSIVRAGDKAHPPLQHILLRTFLEIEAEPSWTDGCRSDRHVRSSLPLLPVAQTSVRDWEHIDRDFSAAIKVAAVERRQITPPVRVTAAGIGRRLHRRGWLAKRRVKMPMSVIAIRSVAEELKAFQLRRLRWHARQCLSEGIVDPWIVLRRAGLRHGQIDLARAELSSMAESQVGAQSPAVFRAPTHRNQEGRYHH